MKKIWILALLPLVACGKDKKTDDSAAEVSAVAFLTTADLTVGSKVTALEKAEVKSKIGNESSLYANEPKDSGSGSGSGSADCFGDAFKSLTLKSGKSSIAFDGTVDLKDCMTKQLADQTKSESGSSAMATTTKVDVATFRVAIALGCTGGDFSAYNGKTFAEIGDAESDNIALICDKGPTRSILQNVDVNMGYTATGTASGITFSSKSTFRSVSASSTATNTACSATLSGSTWTDTSNCTDIDRSLQNSLVTVTGQPDKATDTEDFKKLVASGLTENNDKTSTWYTGGSYNVTYNDWTGTVTYTAATAAPTYSLARGSDTLTGTVGKASFSPKRLLAGMIRAKVLQAQGPLAR